MRRIPYLLAVCIALCGSPAGGYSQVFDNDAGKREKQFIYEVKQLDEFFERFNNDTASFIRRLYKTRGVKYRIDRPALIRSLFNYETRSWPPGAIDSFVKKALPVRMPSATNYYGDGWFAEAICRFGYNGHVVDIPVILRVDTDRNKRSKWIITGVKQTLFASDAALPVPTKPMVPGKFISPVSHCNYFIALGKAFDDKQNLAAYFDPYFFQKYNATGFYNAVLKNQIHFLHVKEIRYHFLQVNNYIFTVENFQRSSLNAGWLISNLTTASAADKQRFTKELLGAQ
jgi:hypothetical protein